MHSSGKTPLIRLAKRDGMAGAGQWGIRIAAILLALVVGGHAVNWTIFGLLATTPSRATPSSWRAPWARPPASGRP